MGRPVKIISEFDVRLGKVVRSKRAKAGLSRVELAELSGIAEANIKRREYGENAITVSELERLAAAMNESAGEMAEEALNDYGGMAKLLAEHGVSEGAYTLTQDDNVTYIGHITPPLHAAADDGPETPPKE
ncbi:helix-turn-helix domain-containing protein [Microbacterium sp. LWH12-1.2]|uniref:helix-turn-helix domain-containing protein n=1 Tax=Microbacterium sp. LWH12-1.2 TaxID=3135259 RepID=UPI003440D77D